MGDVHAFPPNNVDDVVYGDADVGTVARRMRERCRDESGEVHDDQVLWRFLDSRF